MECQLRWQILRPKMRGAWSKEEDKLLEDLLGQGFKYSWKDISAKLKGRTPKQCRERWQQVLHPNLKRTMFTVAEDEIILQMQMKIGNKWSTIGRRLTGRSVRFFVYMFTLSYCNAFSLYISVFTHTYSINFKYLICYLLFFVVC